MAAIQMTRMLRDVGDSDPDARHEELSFPRASWLAPPPLRGCYLIFSSATLPTPPPAGVTRAAQITTCVTQKPCGLTGSEAAAAHLRCGSSVARCSAQGSAPCTVVGPTR